MRSPIPDYLAEVHDTCGELLGGAVADYIPELAAADPDTFAIALATVDGTVYAAGEADHRFTIQSMSKPFTYGIALADRGLDQVLAKVGVEPSGEAFNEISLDPDTGQPRNPMINAGAILTHSLVEGEDADARFEHLRQTFSRIAGHPLPMDEDVFTSEWATTHRNLAMGHMLKAVGVLDIDPVDAVEGYVRQCSITVNCRDLAMMAATLANGGVQPASGELIFRRRVVRQVLSVMTTCGMYDAAGDWLTTVGIPAKSGVSGGIIGALPGQVGIAVFSPRLDEHGNSVRGLRAFERLSRDMGMHLMDVTRDARTSLRGSYVTDGDHPTEVHKVQGDLRFAGVESLVRAVSAQPPRASRVAFDLTRVSEIDDVSTRVLLEVIRRLHLDDKVEVLIIDPDHVLGEHGVEVPYARRLHHVRELTAS
ncbi:glutaminase [Propionibacteriaceae bacterium Y1700]|uniref:glutaminase n=1 Tax=Microlunatus sp. Y1700 TaxID=3418487 RepID=UPI003DA78B3D